MGKKKPKGGGKGTARDAGCANKTPDGRNICFHFNCAERPCCVAKCKFEHVCLFCDKPHPFYDCKAFN